MKNLLKKKLGSFLSDEKFYEILYGSSWSLLAMLLATGMGLVSNVIIAQFYGSEVMGIIALLNSFLLLITIFTLSGTNTSILTLIPEHLAKYSPSSAFSLYQRAQYIVISISLITGFLVFSISDIFSEKVLSKKYLSFYFALSACFIIFKSLTLLNTQSLRGLKMIRLFAIMQALPQGANLFLLIILPLFSVLKDIPIYAYLGSSVLTAYVGWMMVNFTFKQKMRLEDRIYIIPVSKILSISLPMLISSTMAFTMGQIGIIMLGIFKSEAEVGYYSIAFKLATLTGFVLSAVSTMAAPKFAEYYHSSKIEELLYIAKKSTKLIFWTTTPVLICLILFGRPILLYMFSVEFVKGYYALVMLVVGQFINSISGCTGYFMNMTGYQNIYQYIMFFSALINIGLNYFLIPILGINGAAIAAMISISFWNIIALMFIRSKFGATIGYFPFLMS